MEVIRAQPWGQTRTLECWVGVLAESSLFNLGRDCPHPEPALYVKQRQSVVLTIVTGMRSRRCVNLDFDDIAVLQSSLLLGLLFHNFFFFLRVEV